jgi:hypothetical protein
MTSEEKIIDAENDKKIINRFFMAFLPGKVYVKARPIKGRKLGIYTYYEG